MSLFLKISIRGKRPMLDNESSDHLEGNLRRLLVNAFSLIISESSKNFRASALSAYCKSIRFLSMVSAICCAVSGCGAHFNSIYRSDEVGQRDMVMTTDAQQRMILRATRVGTNGEIITCVEPHPDAFTVNAASAAGNFTAPNGLGAALSGASSQSGASLALRTQTNTILREAGYRICEGYINGAVSKLDYAQLLRRNQVIVTAVLAIEQLTGAVVGPAAAIGASSSTEVDKEAVQAANAELAKQETAEGAQKGVVDAKKAAVDQQKAEATKQAKVLEDAKRTLADLEAATPPRPDTEKAEAAQKVATAQSGFDAANKELATREQSLKEEQGKLDGIQSAVATARRNVAQASNPNLKTATSSTLQGPTIVSKDIPAVASAVQNIVELAFTKQHILDLCQMYWAKDLMSVESERANVSNVTYASLGQVCGAVLGVWLKIVEAQGMAAVAAQKDATGTATTGPLTPFSSGGPPI
jgi:hypothetical protein